jgi:RNA polymerase sigma-70 factor (ECF subfamily)
LQESDAADLVQEVFMTLVQKLPEFEYEADKNFRAWLRAVLVNKWRAAHRGHNTGHVQVNGFGFGC